MSETAAKQILQFWSALARGEPQSQALRTFQEQLAEFADAVNAAQRGKGADARALLQAFKVFAPGISPEFKDTGGDVGASAPSRFAGAAASLQARLAQTHAVTATEVSAQNAVQPPDTLQQLFTRWVERYEHNLFELLTEPAFGRTFGDAVNAALECYRNSPHRDELSSAEQARTIARLQDDLAALGQRVADIEARVE